MNKEQALVVFDNYKIRRIYDEKYEISCGGYYCCADPAAGLSSGLKLLESFKEPFKKRG